MGPPHPVRVRANTNSLKQANNIITIWIAFCEDDQEINKMFATKIFIFSASTRLLEEEMNWIMQITPRFLI